MEGLHLPALSVHWLDGGYTAHDGRQQHLAGGDQGVVVFTSDRAAERIQRDHTQQICRLQADQQHR